ncbi:MAG: HAMP domain-containing sensor histidine kinase [Bacteroidota bacterium]
MRTSIFVSIFIVPSIWLSSFWFIIPYESTILGVAQYSFPSFALLLLLVGVGGAVALLWLRYYYLRKGVVHWVRSSRQKRTNTYQETQPVTVPPAGESGQEEASQAASMVKLYQELKMANQDIEIFLYKAYHNFLGPIATIRGVCNVAVLNGQESEAPTHFAQIRQVAESMQTMLEKLLQISVIHNHNITMRSVRLDSFFEDYRNQQPHFPESIQAYFRTSSLDKAMVYTDTFLLTTIIERIVTNAHRFRYSKPHTLTEVFVKYQQNPDYDTIYLKEFGLELPDDTLEHLFKMFQRSSAKPDDHGLGFYAARYAARRVGGDISIESGGGYITFCIQLPRQTSRMADTDILEQVSK